jgi:large subunit ribosomal protein L10
LTRDEKEKLVAWQKEQFKDVKSLILTDYKGLNVTEMNQLRSNLRECGVDFKVLKNTLARRACEGTDVATIADDLVGTRAAAWTVDDDTVPKMAKVLVDFADSHANLELIKGVLGGRPVTPEEMEQLSKMPSRQELLGKLLGTLVAPTSAFVNTLAAVPRSLVNALKAIEDQKRNASPETAAG